MARASPSEARAILQLLKDIAMARDGRVRRDAWNALGEVLETVPEEARAIVQSLVDAV